MLLSIVLATLQVAPGAAPINPVEATVVPTKPPAAATFVPAKPTEPVADPKATVAQPTPGAGVPERPPERPQSGDGSPLPANPAQPAGAVPGPKPSSPPPVEPRATAPAMAQAPAPEAKPRPAEPAAPGFSTPVVDPPIVSFETPREPDSGGSPSVWWLALGAVVLAGAGTGGARIRRRRLVERTHTALSIKPSLDTGRVAPSVPGLSFAGPAASISTRLEAGAARTWAV